MTLEQRYQRLCQTPSSINELLPVLRKYGDQAQSIAEFGVDIGQSTTAFLMAQPKRLLSIDVVKSDGLDDLLELAHLYQMDGDSQEYIVGKTNWTFRIADSRTCTIPKVDLLFIDSAHYYLQMRDELARHHEQVRRWIILHDTFSYGIIGEGDQVGIVPAIGEFLVAHREWEEEVHYAHCNGLQVLRRVE
jgi:predicted O-methyltransferase YrrM